MRKYTINSDRRKFINKVLEAYEKKLHEGKGHTEACDEIAKEQNRRYTQVTYIVRVHRKLKKEASA